MRLIKQLFILLLSISSIVTLLWFGMPNFQNLFKEVKMVNVTVKLYNKCSTRRQELEALHLDVDGLIPDLLTFVTLIDSITSLVKTWKTCVLSKLFQKNYHDNRVKVLYRSVALMSQTDMKSLEL